MIKSRADYLRYLEADRIALERKGRFGFRAWLSDPVWLYERLLRQREYILNCKPNRGIWWVLRAINQARLLRMSACLAITIPPNCVEEGLAITHIGPVVINHMARIGKYCEINVGVNVGQDFKGNAPVIGDYCFMGPGAKIFGAVTLGDCVQVGANAVVTKSFPEGHCSLVGIPAKAIPLHADIDPTDRYGHRKEKS